jgi:cytochrome c553
MKLFTLTIAAAGAAACAFGLVAVAGEAPSTPLQKPEWAYAIPSTPPAPPRPAGAAAPPSDPTLHSLPGTDRRFTLDQVAGRRPPNSDALVGPADWYPGDHPPMPPIVAYGDRARGIVACSLCHYPNGKGRPENATVSGYPKDYLAQTLRDMRAGQRASAEPRKNNARAMVNFAKAMTDAEIEASAAYFSAIPFSPWVRVVESRTAPKTKNMNGLLIPLEGAEGGMEPIGKRIVEVPVEPERTELLRDPRSGYTAYVPPGSLAKGRVLATSGGARTIGCSLCHGADMNGVGPIPGIAGRSPTYMARQLNDFRQGARHGELSPLMRPVAAKLTDDDILNIVAYVASLPPRSGTGAVASR